MKNLFNFLGDIWNANIGDDSLTIWHKSQKTKKTRKTKKTSRKKDKVLKIDGVDVIDEGIHPEILFYQNLPYAEYVNFEEV